MNTDTLALSNAACWRDGNKSPNVELASGILPEVNYDEIGVSSNYAPKEGHQWFVLRATYNRVKTAYEILVEEQIEAYIPKHDRF